MRLRVGFPLRFVFAILRSSLSLIELAIWRDAPFSDDFDFLHASRQGQLRLPFVVSLILLAYINNSRAEAKPDWHVARRAAATGSKPALQLTR